MRILIAECGMELKRALRYRTGVLIDLVVYTLLLCFFFASNTGSSLGQKYQQAEYKTLLLLGYIAWTFASTALSITISQISSEVQRGTFYLKINARCPLQMIYLGDLVSAMIIHLAVAVIYTIVTHWMFGVEYFFNLQVLLAVVICSIGMYGIGLVLAGLSLLFKKVGSLVFLIQLTLLFVTDTVPTDAKIIRMTSLIPLTKCNEVMRSSFSQLPVFESFVLLCVISAVWLAAGTAVFAIFLQKSKKKGNLLLY